MQVNRNISSNVATLRGHKKSEGAVAGYVARPRL